VYAILEERNGLLLAQAIGFKALITIIPLAVFVTGIAANVLQGDRLSLVATDLVGRLLPRYLGEFTAFLDQLGESSGTFTWIGALGLLLSVWMILLSLEAIVSTFIMGPERERRSLGRRHRFVFRISLQVGTVFVLTIALSLAIQGFDRFGRGWLEAMGMAEQWFETGWRYVLFGLGVLIPLLLSASMFFQLYYFIPLPHPPVRSALVGTMVAAMTWEVAKSAFTFYAANVGTFARYREGAGESGVAVLGDTFGLLLAVVVWAYYTGVVLIVGAITVRLHEKHGWGRGHIPPSEGESTLAG
jgi:membrane protein